jgi:hypothetical protein
MFNYVIKLNTILVYTSSYKSMMFLMYKKWYETIKNILFTFHTFNITKMFLFILIIHY